ncbi:MAG: hypothetical protein K9M81_03565, partial [Chthoniobacterales bacterium]|nr:hypothetical protein [Chthoniobacterales bacterium]
ITALVSNCDLGGMYSYSPASQSFARLVLISFARRLMTIQYEISGLALHRFFNQERCYGLCSFIKFKECFFKRS